MSHRPLDLSLPTDALTIVPWPDAVVDLLGHDPRSTYVERFWLPILGPSTYLLLRHLAAGLDESPDGFELPLLDTAQALGLGSRVGRNGPFLRAIDRAVQFKVCRTEDSRTLQVRRRLAPLTRPQVGRLSPPLRDAHDAWLAAAERRPDLDQQRTRARRLALSLAVLGEPDEEIEHQLHRWHVHPALAAESVRWARDHARRAKPDPAGDDPSPDPDPGPGPGGPGASTARTPRARALAERARRQVFDPAGDAA